MYGIHYLTSRKHDQPIEKETSVAATLAEAVAGAKLRIAATKISIPHPIGLLIFDATGAYVLHREYLD